MPGLRYKTEVRSLVFVKPRYPDNMNTFRVNFVSLLILFCLVACGRVGSVPDKASISIVSQTPVLTGQSTLTRTATPSRVMATATPTLESTPTWTPTITATILITATPTITTTISAVGTPDLTPGVEITSTPGVNQTMAITTTTILTKTWTFTDVLITQSGTIRQIALKQDGGLFAAATSIGLFLINAQTLAIERSFNIGEPVQSVAFSPEEDMLVSSNLKGDIQWWFPDTGRYAGTLMGGLLGVNDFSFSAQEEVLVSGSDDGSIRVWNPSQLLDPAINEYEPLNIWRAADRVTSVDVNWVVQMAVAGSYQSVSIWNLGTGELLQALSDFKGWIRDIAFSPDGRILAVVDSSNRLRLWNTVNWILTHDVPLSVFDSITALDYNPNGTMLALGGKNGRIVLWNVSSNTLSDPVTTYAYSVTDVIFHPVKNHLISSYSDGTMRLWSYQP